MILKYSNVRLWQHERQSEITFNQGKNCRNEVIAIIHETFRNASVTRPPQPAAPLTRPIDCRPVGRPVTRGALGEAPWNLSCPPWKNVLDISLKLLDIILKNLDPSQKTLRPTWCPKLVTGLPVCGRASGVPLYIPNEMRGR